LLRRASKNLDRAAPHSAASTPGTTSHRWLRRGSSSN